MAKVEQLVGAHPCHFTHIRRQIIRARTLTSDSNAAQQDSIKHIIRRRLAVVNNPIHTEPPTPLRLARHRLSRLRHELHAPVNHRGTRLVSHSKHYHLPKRQAAQQTMSNPISTRTVSLRSQTTPDRPTDPGSYQRHHHYGHRIDHHVTRVRNSRKLNLSLL